MQQSLNNLRLIEQHILTAVKEEDFRKVDLWRQAGEHEVQIIQKHLQKICKPLTGYQQMIKSNLELPG